MGVFEGMLLIGLTTTTAKMSLEKSFFSSLGKQLLRSQFNRYNLIHPTTYPHNYLVIFHINNQQNGITYRVCKLSLRTVTESAPPSPEVTERNGPL